MKKKQSVKKLNINNKWPSIVLVLLITLGIIFLSGQLKTLQLKARLASIPNQACISIGVALQNKLDLRHYDMSATSSVSKETPEPNGAVTGYKCEIGTVITASTENEQSGYPLGSVVTYFKDSFSAEMSANEGLNKQRSWSVDEEGAKNGFKQSSLFTYIITDVSEPYFEAYTVRDNAIISITLPCSMSFQNDKNKAFDECKKSAQKILQESAQKIQQSGKYYKLQ